MLGKKVLPEPFDKMLLPWKAGSVGCRTLIQHDLRRKPLRLDRSFLTLSRSSRIRDLKLQCKSFNLRWFRRECFHLAKINNMVREATAMLPDGMMQGTTLHALL
jgi:hypothetical protein